MLERLFTLAALGLTVLLGALTLSAVPAEAGGYGHGRYHHGYG